MKKSRKNRIVFVLAFLFIGFGFCRGFADEMTSAVRELAAGIRAGSLDSFSAFTEHVDRASSEQLRYHEELMDLDSQKQCLLNTRVVTKGEDTIVKTDGDSLVVPQAYISDESIREAAASIGQLCGVARENGAEFLYVAAPTKGYGFALPEYITDYRTSNFDRFLAELDARSVPTLDLTAELTAQGKYGEDAFFLTDHHWKPETAFWAVGEICRTLSEEYGFTFDSRYTELENYEVKVYEDWFLGSYGKKVGRFFTDEGAEDISLITPRFDTELEEEQPYKDGQRTGSFSETVLYMDNISTRDYYGKNPYAAYSGGDFRLQIVRNKRNPEGEKILLIRDSYACAAAPFLALNTSELHIVDIRGYSGMVGEKMSVSAYIAEIEPDYVLVLYTGVSDISEASGRYDFS